MNTYVKIKGYTDWFLQINKVEPNGLSELMSEKILRSVCKLHDPDMKGDLLHRMKIAATRTLDYDHLVHKYGTILVRESGSWMTILDKHEITDEVFDISFPINEYANIVICENDELCEQKWKDYLKSRFTNEKIVTINFFDIRNEYDVIRYFEHAKFITFSTTFSSYEWFEKLSKNINNDKHKVIGYSHDISKWEEALNINANVEIVNNI